MPYPNRNQKVQKRSEWYSERVQCLSDSRTRILIHSFIHAGNLCYVLHSIFSSQVALVVKNLPANSGDAREVGSVPGWGRSPGEGNGNPLQYFCLENFMDRRAWRATVHGVTKGQTWLTTSTTSTQPGEASSESMREDLYPCGSIGIMNWNLCDRRCCGHLEIYKLCK